MKNITITFLLAVCFLINGMSAFGQIDRNASYETKVLYYNLELLSSDYLLFGHQSTNIQGKTWRDTSGALDTSDVKAGVGSFPAVYGYDFLGGWNAYRRHIQNTVSRGGIVTFSWHAMNPVTGGDFYDTQGRPMTQIIPGGSANALFKSWLGSIAAFVKSLESDGKLVPIIFRPFHENTGTWFWWGASQCTAEEFKAAWRYTVQCLRDSLGVHNFLYCYSPDIRNAGLSYMDRYPGDDYVDIAGFDLYESDDYSDLLVSSCRTVVNFAQEHGKVAALTETGISGTLTSTSITDWFTRAFLNPLKNDPIARKISWCLFWSNGSATSYWVPTPGDPYFPAFQDFFNDPFTLFENDLPELSLPIIEDTQPPEFTQMPEPDFTSFETNVSIKIHTNERADVRYSLVDQLYSAMPFEFSQGQGGVQHSMIFSAQHGTSYTLYVRAIDSFANATPKSGVVTFTVDTLKKPVFWMNPLFDDTAWKTGIAPLGYRNGSSDVTKTDSVTTVYFRRSFTVTDSMAAQSGLGVLVRGHDGAVIYVNDLEAGRIQIAPDAIPSYDTWATDFHPFTKIFVLGQDVLTSLKLGENLIAVEMHAYQTDQPDLSFDARIFNNNGIYLDFGAQWHYFDEGQEPPMQVASVTSVAAEFDNGRQLPIRITLLQNYPNPFNSATQISYYLSVKSKVRIEIFDVTGRFIGKILAAKQEAGLHSIEWQPDLASGVYIYRIQAGQFSVARKCVLLK